MMKFDEFRLDIYDNYDCGLITEAEKDTLLLYVNEKEEDHYYHMMKKREAAERLGVCIDDLPNKKYKKNPEKADLYYKAKEIITDNEIENYGEEEYLKDLLSLIDAL